MPSKPTKKRQPPKPWSMFPALHEQVQSLLENDGLSFITFHPHDNETGQIDYKDTNVMGRFVCRNPTCKASGWSSKAVAITIRKFPDNKYNARIYHQRCKRCNALSRPKLDDSYAERVAYRLKKWHGVPMTPPDYDDTSKGPHNKALCEGCKAGHCIVGKRLGGGDVEELTALFATL
ncbi:hypothetical protein ASPACDRAFT_1891369 [Aspergillus aculeatus ATCC 16872]|uniref:3CxxC-type domain-containing protein n=1 Tax=Aspergillus aculeatus (strain ATCC 16872 / CBS 172.66 / WB 5094) TaxID=690307 RepID=A0A1L9WID7_ASPA1|nr:uncharacterized protein ASPACDRAFT_1891369 [Aspergillus aculeatus ATCC 16872]OJJ95952.1 hypothetical protein ASPACDRAFT_1891369 [Aspergillus aculeatus ATCC 16872]